MPKRRSVDQLVQQDALADDLVRLIERYRAEWDLSLASIIGCLEMVKLELFDAEKEGPE